MKKIHEIASKIELFFRVCTSTLLLKFFNDVVSDIRVGKVILLAIQYYMIGEIGKFSKIIILLDREE